MKCFVRDCKNSHKKRPAGVTFHKIPLNMKKQWLSAIKQSETTLLNNQRVCSEHFLDSDFEIGQRKNLKSGTIPTRKLPHTCVRKLDYVKVLSEHCTIAVDTQFCEAQAHPSCSTYPNGQSHNTELNVETFQLNSTESEEILETNIAEATSTNNSDTPIDKLENDPFLNRAGISKRSYDSRSSDGASSSSTLKNQRKLISIIHNYSRSPGNYVKQIKRQRERACHYQKKMKSAQRTCNRRFIKINHLKEIVLNLQKKNYLSSSALEHLEKCFSGVPQVLMKRMIKNYKKGKITREEYPPELKSFAATLQFYSDKAYRYVRRVFDLALPAESTIRAWLTKVNCEPGFSQQSFSALKAKGENHYEKHGKPLLCSLMLDEMSLKKQLDVEPTTLKSRGYIDLGCDLTNDEELELATEVLVVMIVGVNDNFKLPIGYFFVNKLTGSEKARIVTESLIQLEPTNVRILSITCDGPQVHFTMMTHLGCQIRNINSLTTYFNHPVNNSPIYIIFDICHMLKLIRNNWEKHGQLRDSDGNIIDWEFIKKLHTIQESHGLSLGNKLRRKHIKFRKAIMKVNLAAQTLSSSVADALEFLNKAMQLQEFTGSEATVNFLRIIDGLFDILNSRNPFGRGYKTPLKTCNENYWRPFLENAITYLSHCSRLDGIPLHSTNSKTPIIGFIVSSISFLRMYDEEVQKRQNLKYILTYKFSQDHLELFFCSVRSRNGWIVNPSCLQFIRTFRRLLLHNNIRGADGNCIAQDQTNILTFTSTKEHLDVTDVHLKRKRDEAVENLQEKIEYTLPAFPLQLNEFSQNVVAYICGYVIRMVEKRVCCPTCLESLIITDADKEDHSSLKLIHRKTRGGLYLPSYSLRQVCFKVEKKIQLIYTILEEKLPRQDICITLLLQDVNKYVLDTTLFKTLDQHVFDQVVMAESHKTILIKNIITSYAKIRLHSLAKIINEGLSGDSVRKTLSRLIIFKHQ